MENRKIIILLATYNRAHFIKETLNSIAVQSYTNWECIIVDDNSVDNTKEVVLDYKRKDIRFSYHLKTQKYKKGLSGTRNYGLDLAKEKEAEFIQFFDDDDLMHPKKLELQLAPFLENPTLNFTVCKYEKLIWKNNKWKGVKPELQLKFSHLGDAILTGEMKMNSLGPLWRSDFIQKFRFDELLRYAEEWELFTRIGYQYPENYEVVDDFLFRYRKHDDTLTLREDNDFERRKTSAIIRIKILEYLYDKKLHTKNSIIFLAKTFLIYSYKPDLVKKLLKYANEDGQLSLKLILFLKTGLIIGKFHRKLITKLASWV